MVFNYNSSKYKNIEELVRYDTVFRMPIGFVLKAGDLPQGIILPPLAPLNIDIKKREATPLIRVRVLENASSNTIKVNSVLPLKSGMYLSTGGKTLTISEVEDNGDYISLTVSEDASGIKKGTILFEASDGSGNKPKLTANYLNYASTEIKAGATITAIAKAYCIEEDKLYVPVSTGDKKTLTDRFIFI